MYVTTLQVETNCEKKNIYIYIYIHIKNLAVFKSSL